MWTTYVSICVVVEVSMLAGPPMFLPVGVSPLGAHPIEVDVTAQESMTTVGVDHLSE